MRTKKTHSWEGFLPKNAIIMASRQGPDATIQEASQETSQETSLEGNTGSRVLFVGVKDNSPFVGEAGDFFDKMISAIGLARSQAAFLQIRRDQIFQGSDLILQAIGQSPQFDHIVLVDHELEKLTQDSSLRGITLLAHPDLIKRDAGVKKRVWLELKKLATDLGLAVPTPKGRG